MSKHELAKADREFRQAFEAGAIAPADFSHRAHVRLAYVHVAAFGVDAARGCEPRAPIDDVLQACLRSAGGRRSFAVTPRRFAADSTASTEAVAMFACRPAP